MVKGDYYNQNQNQSFLTAMTIMDVYDQQLVVLQKAPKAGSQIQNKVVLRIAYVLGVFFDKSVYSEYFCG